MKTFHNIIRPLVCLAAIATGFACERMEEQPITGPAGTSEKTPGVAITIDCADASKTALDGMQPVWKAGDGIWISDGDDAYYGEVPAEYDGMTRATITVQGIHPDSTLYALYPWQDSAYVSKNILYASVPVVQDGNFKNTYMAVGKSEPGSKIISFNNSTAMLHFELNSEAISLVQLHNPNANITGNFKITPETGEKYGNASGFRKVLVNTKGSGVEYNISVMACTLPKDAPFTFITADGRMGTIRTSVANSLVNGTYYDLGVLDDRITWDPMPATDLGAEETANCYIVDGPGSYRFPAVKGNSRKALDDVAFADVVWETVNTTTAPKKYSLASEVAYSKGYVYFRIPDSAPSGNILLSACDINGQILWSWHIWYIKGGVADQTWPSGAVMMDRNLGALSAAASSALSNGFFYQYGRKDPFTAPAKRTATNLMAVTGTAIKNEASNDERGTDEYATTHPTSFIYRSSGDWLAEEDLTLWSASAKTVHDPCPPGYHVPYESVLSGITADNTTVDDTNKGRILQHKSQTIWFPFTGNRYSGDGTIKNSGSTHYCFFDQTTSTNNMCSWNATSSAFGIGTTASPHASGFSIRCQKYVSSGVTSVLKLYANITDTSYGYPFPTFTGEAFGSRSMNWSDGTTNPLPLTSTDWHYYKSTGEFIMIMTCTEIKTAKVSLADIVRVDFTEF